MLHQHTVGLRPRHDPSRAPCAFPRPPAPHSRIPPLAFPSRSRLSFSQAKAFKTPGSLAGWPKNAVKAILNLVENAEANAETNGLKTDSLYVDHSQVNMAPKGRRRTYRAHGRINPYLRVPSHIEIVLKETVEPVPKAEGKPVVRAFKRKLAARVAAGGGQ
jgi:hypothetical protein